MSRRGTASGISFDSVTFELDCSKSRPQDTPPPATRENNAKLIFACLNLMTWRFDIPRPFFAFSIHAADDLSVMGRGRGRSGCTVGFNRRIFPTLCNFFFFNFSRKIMKMKDDIWEIINVEPGFFFF